jgi:hypothetical protein
MAHGPACFKISSTMKRPGVNLNVTDTIRRTAHWPGAVQLQLARIDHAVSENRTAPMEPGSVMARIARLEMDEVAWGPGPSPPARCSGSSR